MRRYGIALCLFAACVMASGVALGVMANGPGGRIYLEGVTSGYTLGNDIGRRVTSVQINADWTISTWEDHGFYVTNKWVDGYHYGLPQQDGVDRYPGAGYGAYRNSNGGVDNFGGLQIQVSRPTGYADFIVGAYQQGLRDATSLMPIMDVVKITPTVGSMTDTVIGGRGSTGALANRHTEQGTYALPDPAGLFTGPNAQYVVARHTTGYYNELWGTVANTGSGVGAVDADYILTKSYNKWSPANSQDYEIVGDHLFSGGNSQTSQYTPYGGQQIRVVRRVDDTTYPGSTRNNTTFEGIWFQPGIDGFPYHGDCLTLRYSFNRDVGSDRWIYGQHGIAAGKVKDAAGADRLAVWQFAYDRVDLRAELVMFVDLNGDDDAMDAGEQVSIYDNDTTTGNAFADPKILAGLYRSWDLELIDDGAHKFLLAKVDPSGYNSGYLIVWQLADNGNYAGGNDKVKQIAQSTFLTGNYRSYGALEMDYAIAAIPEPATLLLVGTGLLGTVGWMRRRRMR